MTRMVASQCGRRGEDQTSPRNVSPTQAIPHGGYDIAKRILGDRQFGRRISGRYYRSVFFGVVIREEMLMGAVSLLIVERKRRTGTLA